MRPLCVLLLFSLIIPAWADARRDYLTPMLACGGLTIVLAILLTLVTTLPLAAVVLIVIGGPAGGHDERQLDR